MGFTRITEDDINNKGVVGLPDTPNLSTAEMQEKFDEIALAVIIPKVNNLIAEIEAKTASAGIGIDVDDELSEEKKLQPAFAKLYEIVKSLGSSNHSHDNKDALDGITDTLLTELNEIITLLDGITDVSNEINGRATALATCKAVADYVQELGGGDMTRAMYDTNRNGIVDDAEKLGGNLPEYYQSATDETLQTTDKTIVGAINEVKTGLENAEVDTLTTLEQVEASTDDTIPVGAGAVKELNGSLSKVRTYVGSDGKLHFVNANGADTVLPFSAGFTEAYGFYFNAGIEYPFYIDFENYRFVEGTKNTGISGKLISVFHSSDSYKYRVLKDCEVISFAFHPKNFSGVVKYSAGDAVMVAGYDGLHKSNTAHIVLAREV